MEKNIDYKAKSIINLDDEYRNTGVYNGSDIRGAAHRNFEEIMENHPAFKKAYNNMEGKKYLVSVDEENISFDVNDKEIPKEKYEGLKTAGKVIATVAIVGGIAFMVWSVLNLPEQYLTTHPDYSGPASNGFTETISNLYEWIVNKIGGLKR